MGTRTVVSVLAWGALITSGCNQKPPHYLVVCDEKDARSWELISVVEKNGYIMSCTYRSPDRDEQYTRACDESGCSYR